MREPRAKHPADPPALPHLILLAVLCSGGYCSHQPGRETEAREHLRTLMESQ